VRHAERRRIVLAWDGERSWCSSYQGRLLGVLVDVGLGSCHQERGYLGVNQSLTGGTKTLERTAGR
jgi:hypothetical protein